jgi:hypothetical protein
LITASPESKLSGLMQGMGMVDEETKEKEDEEENKQAKGSTSADGTS